MQLTYRGITYTPSTTVSTPQTHRFTYRGVSFDSTLNRVTSACEGSVKLVYRGLTYHCPSKPVLPSQQSRVLNWRYQVA